MDLDIYDFEYNVLPKHSSYGIIAGESVIYNTSDDDGADIPRHVINPLLPEEVYEERERTKKLQKRKYYDRSKKSK